MGPEPLFLTGLLSAGLLRGAAVLLSRIIGPVTSKLESMVDLSLATDEFGLLRCTLVRGNITATASASNVPDAVAGLVGLVDNAAANGLGECFWPRASGAYRWLLRREQSAARLVVLWSNGTMTGWEHVFWAECEWEPLERMMRERIACYRVPVSDQ